MAYLPEKILERKLLLFLQEDIDFGDITGEFVPEKNVEAHLFAKQSGVLCGLNFAKILLNSLGLKNHGEKKDGDMIAPQELILTIEGSSKLILVVERTILNLLMRLSGISSQTKTLVDIVKKSNKPIVIASTRKTTPGLRYFEKYAVKIGGGDPHRWSLSDTILIKENHLVLFHNENIGEIVTKFKQVSSFTKKIDIEVETIEEFEEVLESDPDIIMLDDFSPDLIRKSIELMNNHKLIKKPLIEISGGIDAANIKNYLLTGVDIISIGALTHSVKSIDFSLKIQS
ncbi:MAG: carboxylating nicotinate-nucleotide diphosphorylase [Candidatus Heimdallarchaeota archaeon]|nr:carboxylating nicotinate-nucleotide diphosphorylase [Candidatus Heimdallarchaeota archaeon]